MEHAERDHDKLSPEGFAMFFCEELSAVVHGLTDQELESWRAMSPEELDKVARLAVARKLAQEFLDEKVRQGEIVRLPNGNYRKVVEESRNKCAG